MLRESVAFGQLTATEIGHVLTFPPAPWGDVVAAAIRDVRSIARTAFDDPHVDAILVVPLVVAAIRAARGEPIFTAHNLTIENPTPAMLAEERGVLFTRNTSLLDLANQVREVERQLRLIRAPQEPGETYRAR